MSISEQLNHHVEEPQHLQPNFLSREQIEEARAEFLHKGMPTVKDEEWKFTPLSGVLTDEMQLDFSQIEEYVDPLHTHDLIQAHLKEIQSPMKGDEKGAYRLVLNRGQIAKDLCYLPDEKSCRISYLSESEIAQGLVGSLAQTKLQPMTALNTATVADGIVIQVSKGTQLDMPLHIIHVEAATHPTFAQRRMMVYLEKDSKVDLIETYVTNATTPVHQTVNVVYEIFLEERARCNHYDIQKTGEKFHQIKRTVAKQGLHSRYSNYCFNLPGGKFFRNNLAINIEAKDTECDLFGLYLTADNQLVDHHTEVHHKLPNCQSNQHYKGVLLDNSKAVFNGKIFVYEDAQKTNAFQKSANLLLSDKASVNAKPQLEIFADDVKCSHGSTIGQLDEQALFYLRSRGISKSSARQMLVNAFAYDVAANVENDALRHYLEQEITLAIQ